MSDSNPQKKGKKRKFSRRKFIVRSAVGVGVLMGTGYVTRPIWRRGLAGFANSVEAPYSGDTKTPPLWFEVKADNQIIFHSPKVEMGQGSFTSLAQIAADELEVNIDQIQIVHAATATGNIDGFSTGGSTTISGLWQPLRELAATMREMLKNEAAKVWSTTAAELTVKDGVVSGNGKSMTYGEIVKGVEAWDIPKTPPLKDIKDYKFVGKPIPRVDLEDKVLGAPIFGIDATMPDMLYGAVVRSAKIGAKYIDADTSEAEKMPGVVKVVKEPDFVGVVAESRMEAENAKKAIKVTWETEKNWQSSDIEDMIKVGRGEPITIQKQGRAKRILNNEQDIITSEFTSPLGAHAQLEPNGAVAHVEGDKATVIISTQVINLTRTEVAKRLGLKKENVIGSPTKKSNSSIANKLEVKVPLPPEIKAFS